MDEKKQIGGRALLVDDEYISQHVGSLILKGIGLNVDIAVNAKEALDKIADKHYDLVLMDIQMPDMSGLKVTELIRSMEEETGADPSVILAITASIKDSTKEQCLAAGMNDLLIKPIQSESIIQYLRPWMFVDTDDRHFNSPGELDPEKSVDNGLNEQVVWDRTQALKYLGGDEDLLIDMMQLFISRKNKLLNTLEDAMKTTDGEAISSAAHAFKGAVNHFAAKRCQKLAFTIESNAENGWLDDLDTYFSELKEAAENLENDLKQQLATNPG